MNRTRPSQMLSVREFAGRLGIRESTARSWILRRTINYFKVGGRVVIGEDEVDRILSAGAVPAAAELPRVRAVRAVGVNR